MIAYVLGYLFNATGTSVLLMKKQKPDWMCNKFNGVGGKVEENETPLKAMVREFAEETSCTLEDWQYYASLSGEGWTVDVFAAFNTDAMEQVIRTPIYRRESVHVFEVEKLPLATIPNARWLITMALSMTRGETCAGFAVQEIRRGQ